MLALTSHLSAIRQREFVPSREAAIGFRECMSIYVAAKTYLASLHVAVILEHQNTEKLWHSSFFAVAVANASQGKHSFQRHRATCHSAGGRMRWQADFELFAPESNSWLVPLSSAFPVYS